MQKNIEYCLNVLPQVSRTFAPTIRLLPKGLNVPVTVAYLLCRIADTIEDSADLSLEQKRIFLNGYMQLFENINQNNLDTFMDMISVIPKQTPDENLAHNLERVWAVYTSFSETTRKHIGRWVVEMSKGMHKYAQSTRKKRFTFLKTMQELDEYTYYVAGTVGYLLTELFSHYSKKITPPLKGRLELFAESFGKGLQLVNIIRDMSTDIRRGQSYIPDELLRKYKLSRETIYEKDYQDQVQEMFNELIISAVKHLDKALNYIVLIPKNESRIRLFCMLPLFWAMRTLQKIQENTLALLNSDKIKIPRTTIRREYYVALINSRSNRLMRRHYNKIRREIEDPLIAA
ncbi:MAG: hypothetical protein GF313_09950 [Caldithrix sp.]|nr:hypothetical protein [Caldithrix sp.]